MIEAVIMHQEIKTNVTPAQNRQISCLQEAIYFEARGESLKGQALVGDVIANRVKSSQYPNSYCGVINQRGQFSYTSRRNKALKDKFAAQKARIIAQSIYFNDKRVRGISKGAVFFHTKNVKPRWNYSKLRVTHRVGNHIFYSLRKTL